MNYCTVVREGTGMAPTVESMPLLEGVNPDGRLRPSGTRWRFEQHRDERIYQRRWFEDYRAWCLKYLRAHRDNFRARLDAACADYVARYGEGVPS